MNLSKIEAFIFDLDGVIWRGETAIAGAVESLARLKKAGKKCFFCTNNSGQTQADFAAKLRRIGIELDQGDVFSSASATAGYLKREMDEGFSAYVIGGDGILEALKAIGARVLTGETEINEIDCVVVGIDRAFSYAKLRTAQRLILNGARFVATNRDATYPVEGGVTPGAGSIVAAVETASGQTPVTIGKPEPLMLQLCIEQFGLNPQTTAMVGDRLDTDIACAHRAGIAGLWVATGVASWPQAQNASGDERPDAMFDDLPALCRAVL